MSKTINKTVNKFERPKIIAFSSGLDIIPFENVIGCTGSSEEDGVLIIKLKDGHKIWINRHDSPVFIDQYNSFLAVVEALTMTKEI